MRNDRQDRKQVLLRIKQGELTPEEGLALLREAPEGDLSAHSNAPKTKDIAVIGMSCRVPGADNLYEFWSNLESGTDSVAEIARERWDNREVYNPDVKVPGTTACRWGGMLKDIEQFDPLFFGISQKEAELMDPQQRLFLMEAWRAIEHAGYPPAQLSGTRCGVFVGVGQGDYQSLLRSSGVKLDSHVLTGSSSSMLAARISYFLNLTGPNMPIDTACSSSLVAVHQACLSILHGESEMALAGGVNVLSTPEMHIMTSKGGMLSKDGRCRAFDDRADGFVPGEAAGAILLKPLDRAIQDGDTIYGVIKASGVNQDGRTNGITAPSANSQTRLERDIYSSAGINPQTISYMEAHGTGTQLGDPIEVHALTQAFEEYTQQRQFCAIGSVKTNIGHSLTAAGIVGLIKIMLCFKEEKLVPSLHYKRPNPHIRFEDSPFYVNTSLREWKRGADPRRAAISSFGLSGTNCHLIMEEPPLPPSIPERKIRPFYLLPLSAKNPELLRTMWKRLEIWLSRETGQITLDDLCATLAAGRTHFPYRSAIVVQDMEDLWEILYLVAEGNTPAGYYAASVPKEQHDSSKEKLAANITSKLAYSLHELSDGEYFAALSELAGLYAAGYDAGLAALYAAKPYRKLSLPVYPFLRDKCWVPEQSGASEPALQPNAVVSSAAQETDMSVFQGRSEISRMLPQLDAAAANIVKLNWSGGERCLTDHLVNGMPVLPGAAYIELVRSAGELMAGRKIVGIRHIAWLRPFLFSQPGQQMAVQFAGDEAEQAFTVSSVSEDGTEIRHAQGSLAYAGSLEPGDGPAAIDITAFIEHCTAEMDSEQCYRMHRSMGVAFEASFRTIKRLWCGEREVLAELELPSAGTRTADSGLLLHPALLDGALQTVIGLNDFHSEDRESSYLPFLIEQVRWSGALADVRYVYTKPAVRAAASSVRIRKYDILMTDSAGQIVASLEGVTARAADHHRLSEHAAGSAPVPRTEAEDKPFTEAELFLFRAYWPERPVPAEPSPGWPSSLLLLHGGGGPSPVSIIRRLAGSHGPDIRLIEAMPGPAFQILSEDRYLLNPAQPEDYHSLTSHLARTGNLPETIWNLWPLSFNRGAVSREQLECHMYPPLFLAQAFMRSKRAAGCTYIHLDYAGNPYSAAVGGLGKTLKLEHPGYVTKAVQVHQRGGHDCSGSAGSEELDYILRLALQESQAEAQADTEVSYSGGIRRVKAYRKAELAPAGMPESMPELKEQGVYLITGGAGGLGTLFAQHAAGYSGVKLVLAGRSAPDDLLNARLKSWRKLGVEVEYRTCRLQNREETQRLVDGMISRYGRIDGIIHSAGVIRDALVWNKTVESVLEVADPKVAGTVNLDEATKKESLDFFVLFSAIASVFGNTGQADYAYANSFIDYFAESREALVMEGKRRGKTLSLNWPLWQEGGMKAGPDRQDALFKRLGMYPLATRQGIHAFNLSLQAPGSQVVVMTGEEERIRQALKMEEKPAAEAEPAEAACAADSGRGGPVVDEMEITGHAEEYLRGLIAQATRLSKDRIGIQEQFSTYGIDSILVVELNTVFEEIFGELPKTLMFEYGTIRELAGYFVQHHRSLLEPLFQQRHMAPEAVQAAGEQDGREQQLSAVWTEMAAGGPQPRTENTGSSNAVSDIAIIGLAGMFPQAENVEQFWANLLAGKDCIEEIPAERWDYSRYYVPDKDAEGTAYSKWGGFLPDVDKFDPLFFSISPREADRIDPQERLFLQTAWKTVEDAGYTRSSLEQSAVGVFVGAMYGHYEQVARDMAGEGGVQVHSSFSSIANRVSYALNLTGPSIALDTMCSSSLTAIHLACQSIRSGDCDLAIAGGVNVTVHPAKHLLLSQGKFLSTDGRCRSFGEGGDGYVPGEGVGAVLLKPLGQAIQDRDHIYAVIKGSSLNHGGTTNGYTVPNPSAQAKVVARAFRRANIDPASVSCMEAHGTGTALGDPIEIEGLIQAFGDCGGQTQFIPIGSVKSNAGHLESAAGIAGVTKVLLQLKHRKLVPSLHAEQLNPNIRFARSPFYVQRAAADWKRPVKLTRGTAQELPRIAGVSAFGAGGSNAHVLLQEHEAAFRRGPEPGPQLFVLSARNEDRLRAYATDMLKAVPEEDEADGWALADMAFTLQSGREPLEERIAVIAASGEELKTLLNAYLQGTPRAGFYTGNLRKARRDQKDGHSAAFLQEETAALVKQKDLHRLAEMWVNGRQIDFGPLYAGKEVRRMSLPTYPFEKKRCWLSPAPSSDLSSVAPEVSKAQKIQPVSRPAVQQVKAVPIHGPELLNYNGSEVGLDIIDGQIAVVTMQDRSSSNTFSEAIIRGVTARFAQIAANGKVKVVVLTGFDRIFSMGGTQEQLLDIAEQRSAFTDNPFFYRGLLETEVPVISAMQGHASGGGMLFGLYADIVLMAEEGVYSAVFTKFGFTPGMGATFVLKEKLGALLSTEMMFTAKSYTGGELGGRGASVLVKPGAEVLGEALKIARMLAEKPLHTLKVLKRELAGRYLDQLQPYIDREAEMHGQTFSHPEVMERIRHYYVNGAEKVKERVSGSAGEAGSLLSSSSINVGPVPGTNAVTGPAASLTIREAAEVISGIVDDVLHIRLEEGEMDCSFRELGVDSISGVEMIRDLNLVFNLNLDAVALYDYSTVELLAAHVVSHFPASAAAGEVQPLPPAPATATAEQPHTGERNGLGSEVEPLIGTIVGTLLHLSSDELDTEASFRELGADSISGVEIIRDINKRFGINLDATALYDYPSIREISSHVHSSLSREGTAVSGREVSASVQSPVREEAPSLSSYLFKSQTGYGKENQPDRTATKVSTQPKGTASVKLAPAGRAKPADTINSGAGTVTGKPEEPEPEPCGKTKSAAGGSVEEPEAGDGDIAVIGIAGRFPGARNVHEFWENLKNGIDSTGQVPASRWDAEQYYSADPREPNRTYSSAGGFLENVDEFDPLFFNISPAEAESMDPQQRIFLEEAWHALEDAGYGDQSLQGTKCGVFVGACQGDYVNKLSGIDADKSGDAFTGNSSSILAARISYVLNLKGPSVAVDTACSSSLVAIHQACLSIRSGDSDMALAGGVRVMLTPGLHIQSSQMEMLTPTGVCRAFDRKADGTVLGEGAGVVVLKPLADARRDRDYIYGVIKGSGVNQDGRTNGITAPSAQSQTGLELEVYRKAGISPEHITYVETHGTGTRLGDPIEVKALKDSFETYTKNKQYCAIGSVKPNIGHTTMAAGAASLIKVLLSLKYKQLVPSLHFDEENEHIRFADSPFYVNTALQDWQPAGNGPRVAAVSSFGFSGTNCHLVVEEAAELSGAGN